MATLTILITVEQIRELARQLSPQERQALVDGLLAERFEAVLAESDRLRDERPSLTDEQIQAEIDDVRGNRMNMREEHRRASSG